MGTEIETYLVLVSDASKTDHIFECEAEDKYDAGDKALAEFPGGKIVRVSDKHAMSVLELAEFTMVAVAQDANASARKSQANVDSARKELALAEENHRVVCQKAYDDIERVTKAYFNARTWKDGGRHE